MKRFKFFFVLVVTLVVLFSCGGGGGGGGGDEEESGSNQTPDYFSGFDFVLSEGDYWEFYWSSHSTSGSQDSSSSSSDSGSFTITLGAPGTVGNLDAYPLLVTGKTTDSDNFQYSPEWTHVAISDNRIYGSIDGINFEVVFIAASTQWEGGGFFTDFGSSDISASSSSVSNDFISTSAIATGRYQSQSNCEYYPGVGSICPNDESYTISEREYYKAGIGPVAYRYSLSYSNDGAGFTTWSTRNRELGLVSTNLSSPDGFAPSYPPWYQKASLTSSMISGYSAAAVNGKIYLTGGKLSSTRYSSLNIYDPAADTWSTGASMPSGRSDHASVELNGKLYVTGGYSSTVTDTVFEYDPTLDSWSTVSPSMAVSRASHIVVVTDGALVALGGVGLSTVEYVYPGGSFGNGSNLPRQLNYMGGAASGTGDDRRIYLFGGVKYNAMNSSCNEAEYLSYSYELNPFTWDWTTRISMSTARADLSVAELNNKLYAIGGRNCNGDTNAVEMYDPALNTWASVSPMLSSTQKSRVAVVNGKIYVFYADDGKINVEEYDPARE